MTNRNDGNMAETGKKLTVTFEGKLAECIRRQSRNEGVPVQEWVRILAEVYLLKGTTYTSVDELYDDNYKEIG